MHPFSLLDRVIIQCVWSTRKGHRYINTEYTRQTFEDPQIHIGWFDFVADDDDDNPEYVNVCMSVLVWCENPFREENAYDECQPAPFCSLKRKKTF